MRKIIAACAVTALAAAAGLVIAMTGGTSAGAGGSAPGWTQLNGGSAPYNYPSVAFTCHGPDGVYVSSFSNDGATAGGGITVVINDPECVPG